MSRASKPIYAPLPARAIGDARLTALDIRVLAVLAAHDRLGANGIGCYASHPRLAALVGCHEKSLSRSLATLAGNAGGQKYIEAGRHPLNGKLRVYRVIYNDFDKAFIGQTIGNEPATNQRGRKGNEPATETALIGNQLAPALVTEPAGFPEGNQGVGSVNIFSETGIHPVEAGNTFSEAAPSVRENARNGSAAEASEGLWKGTSSVGAGAMLAMIERGIKAGTTRNSAVWRRYLEGQIDETDERSPLTQQARRLLEALDEAQGRHDSPSIRPA